MQDAFIDFCFNQASPFNLNIANSPSTILQPPFINLQTPPPRKPMINNRHRIF